jgi:hypothetical protein
MDILLYCGRLTKKTSYFDFFFPALSVPGKSSELSFELQELNSTNQTPKIILKKIDWEIYKSLKWQKCL